MQNETPVVVTQKPQSNTLAGVGTALASAALVGVGWNAVGNTLNRYLGNGTVQPSFAPFAAPHFAPYSYAPAAFEGGLVSKEVACLMAENSQLKAEKYTDMKFEIANNKICDLQTAYAVNATRDKDFRRYVNSEFIHQPKAHMKHRLLETSDECCCNCGHGHGNHFSHCND